MCIEKQEYLYCLQGDNLDSVLVKEIRVTIGGGVCTITAVQTSRGLVCDFKTIIITKHCVFAVL